MLKLIPVLLILIIAVVAISCQPTKDTTSTTPETPATPKEEVKEVTQNDPNDLIGFTWNIAYIQELDARILPKKSATFTFREKNKAAIMLSVNSCVASYNATGTTIKITEEGCTEACCDDDFDRQLLALIRANQFSYELKDSKLVLTASNSKIVLSKK
jgi:heat shock protein HslJ